MKYEEIRERANVLLLSAMEKIEEDLQNEKAPQPVEAAEALARLANAISEL